MKKTKLLSKVRNQLEMIRKDSLARFVFLMGFLAWCMIFMFGLGYMAASLHYESIMGSFYENQREFKEFGKEINSMMMEIQKLKNEERIFGQQMLNIIEYYELFKIITEDSEDLQERISDED